MSNELLKRIFSSIVLIPIIFFSIIKGEFYFNILYNSSYINCNI